MQYRKLIAQGVEKGVNAKEIVVDQTLLGEINLKKCREFCMVKTLFVNSKK
jgi:hypothetical protein